MEGLVVIKTPFNGRFSGHQDTFQWKVLLFLKPRGPGAVAPPCPPPKYGPAFFLDKELRDETRMDMVDIT